MVRRSEPEQAVRGIVTETKRSRQGVLPRPPVRSSAVFVALALTGVMLVSCSSSAPGKAAGKHPGTVARSSVPTTTTSVPTTTTSAPAPDFSSFVGSWYAHESGLVVNASGGGTLSIPDYPACPTCTDAGTPLNTVMFQLTSVSGSVSDGKITSSTDAVGLGESGKLVPDAYRVGGPIQITLRAGSPGELITVVTNSIESKQFCNMAADDANQCGA